MRSVEAAARRELSQSNRLVIRDRAYSCILQSWRRVREVRAKRLSVTSKSKTTLLLADLVAGVKRARMH